MPTAGSHIAVIMVDKLPKGAAFRRKRMEWPLHVTVMPWFSVAKPQHLLLQDLETITKKRKSFRLAVDSDALFGPKKDISVSLVQKNENISSLHQELLRYVLAHGAVEDSYVQWLGDAYRPHITHHGKIRPNTGDIISADGLTIVKLLEDDICEVVTDLQFGGRLH